MSPIENYPAQYESRLILKNGKEIFIRPVVEADLNLIVDLELENGSIPHS